MTGMPRAVPISGSVRSDALILLPQSATTLVRQRTHTRGAQASPSSARGGTCSQPAGGSSTGGSSSASSSGTSSGFGGGSGGGCLFGFLCGSSGGHGGSSGGHLDAGSGSGSSSGGQADAGGADSGPRPADGGAVDGSVPGSHPRIAATNGPSAGWFVSYVTMVPSAREHPETASTIPPRESRRRSSSPPWPAGPRWPAQSRAVLAAKRDGRGRDRRPVRRHERGRRGSSGARGQPDRALQRWPGCAPTRWRRVRRPRGRLHEQPERGSGPRSLGGSEWLGRRATTRGGRLIGKRLPCPERKFSGHVCRRIGSRRGSSTLGAP
jgi:hypothetical protein